MRRSVHARLGNSGTCGQLMLAHPRGIDVRGCRGQRAEQTRRVLPCCPGVYYFDFND